MEASELQDESETPSSLSPWQKFLRYEMSLSRLPSLRLSSPRAPLLNKTEPESPGGGQGPELNPALSRVPTFRLVSPRTPLSPRSAPTRRREWKFMILLVAVCCFTGTGTWLFSTARNVSSQGMCQCDEGQSVSTASAQCNFSTILSAGDEAPLQMDGDGSRARQVSHPDLSRRGAFVPISLRHSELVIPAEGLQVRNFGVDSPAGSPGGGLGGDSSGAILLQTRDVRGRNATSGGALFYARLSGPSLVVAKASDLGSGRYAFFFDVPLPGTYNLDLILLYERWQETLDAWEEMTPQAEDIEDCYNGCSTEERGGGLWSTKVDDAIPFEACASECRTRWGAPLLRDERLTWNNITVWGAPTFLQREAPLCGVDGEGVDQVGYWVNASAVCRDATNEVAYMECRQSLIVCPPDAYEDSGHILCHSELVWRPIRCRHVAWNHGLLPAPESLESLRARLNSLNSTVLFCGDASTAEIGENFRSAYARLQVSVKGTVRNDSNPRLDCLGESPQVFISGGCGWNSAKIATLQRREILRSCEEEAKAVGAMEELKLYVHRSAPATFPSLFGPKQPWAEVREIDGEAYFHGQRHFLANAALESLEGGIASLLARGNVTRGRYMVLDAYAMTLPLWGVQQDGFHWGERGVASQGDWVLSSVNNNLASLLVKAISLNWIDGEHLEDIEPMHKTKKNSRKSLPPSP